MSSSLLVAPCLWLAFQREHRRRASEARRRCRAATGWRSAREWLLTLPLMLVGASGHTFANPEHPASWLRARFIHTTMLLCIGVFVGAGAVVPAALPPDSARTIAGPEPGIGRSCRWPSSSPPGRWRSCAPSTARSSSGRRCSHAVVAVISVGVTVGALYLLLREFRRSGARRARQLREIAGSARRSARASGASSKPRSAEDAIYKRSDLSLRALSEALKENPHYVSQVISQELNTSFYELVNRYRVEHAKRLLRESPTRPCSPSR